MRPIHAQIISPRMHFQSARANLEAKRRARIKFRGKRSSVRRGSERLAYPMSDGNFGLSIGAVWWNLRGCCVLLQSF